MGDFETTTDPNDCRVWLWMLCNVNDVQELPYGTNISSFIEYVTTMPNAHIYFHNLAFDGAFILDYLLNMGFVHVKESPKNRQFTTLISNTGKFYSIRVKWETGHSTEFRDSLKKLPMSVSNVAKSFKLVERKGSIDYDELRSLDHIPTVEELEYITNDVRIIAHALRRQFAEGMTRLTVGSDSLAEFKSLSGKTFGKLFPILPVTMDADIRKSYRGGFTYADSRFKGVINGAGLVFDVNSLYPAVMYSELMPYGEPKYFEGSPIVTDIYPLYIVSITFTARLKPNKIPCIQVKGSMFFVETEYQTNIIEPITLSCTNVDLALWQDHYDLQILAYNGGWKFHGINGVFNDYIEKWSAVKSQSDGGMRVIAKLHLTSLYGKFATNPDITPKIPVLEDGIVKLKLGLPENRDPVYTAMGAFITAYARNVTIRAAQDNYFSFAYADTDSLHLLTDNAIGINIHPNALGAWKLEYEFVRAIYVRAKCYAEQLIDNSHVVRVAGLPESISETLTIDSLTHQQEFSGKLSPTRVKGGIVLTDVGFTLKP